MGKAAPTLVAPNDWADLHFLLRQHLSQVPELARPSSPAWRSFLALIDSAYRKADADRARLQDYYRRLSKPLIERNAELRRQIDERERAEARLEYLLVLLGTTIESAADGIAVLDEEHRIIRFNQQFALIWRIPDEVLAFRRHQEVFDLMLVQLANPQAFLDGLERLRRFPDSDSCEALELSDGRVVECYALPRPPGVGGVGRVLSFRDITTRLRAEEALRRERDAQQALLKKLEETHGQLLQSELASVGQLAAGVAHEINDAMGLVNSNFAALQRYLLELLRVLDAYERVEQDIPAQSGSIEELRKRKQEADLDCLRKDLPALIGESEEGMRRVLQIVQDLKEFSHADGGGFAIHRRFDGT